MTSFPDICLLVYERKDLPGYYQHVYTDESENIIFPTSEEAKRVKTRLERDNPDLTYFFLKIEPNPYIVFNSDILDNRPDD